MPTFDAFITTIIRIWGGFITTFIRIWGGFITTIIRIWGGGKPSEPGLPCHWEPGQEKLGSGRYLHDADATNDDESLMISMLKCMLIIMISPLPRGAPRPLDYLTTPTTQTIPYSSFRKLWRKEEDTFPQTIGICGRGSSAHIYCLLPKNEDKLLYYQHFNYSADSTALEKIAQIYLPTSAAFCISGEG